MTDHPITPPPELYKQWEGKPRSLAFEAAYRAGADQELEACCEWINREIGTGWGSGTKLRTARRPKPPSLAEQGFELLDSIEPFLSEKGTAIMRRALERLQELENNG